MPYGGRLRVGFISTRIAGTDGVSLEIEKWAAVLERMGHDCFYFAGECDRDPSVSMVFPAAYFEHPDVKKVNADLFDDDRRSPETSELVRDLRRDLKSALTEFVDRFEIELLIIENALSIPMNVPLGLALTELIAETKLPTIGHHHDFAWERSRFAVNAAEDYLTSAFPPAMSAIKHVVINSFAATQLAYRTGMRSTLVPNVMDFGNPPVHSDRYADDLRRTLGLSENEVFLLQPTRVVPRKRIERAIELARRLDRPAAVVISHASGDEGSEYLAYLEDYAAALEVKLIYGDRVFSFERGTAPDGRKTYSLEDAYRQCDLVTYPSSIEGFGNAFLEALYFRKPIMTSIYDIFRADIAPKGFDVVSFDEFITRDTIAQVRRVLDDEETRNRMVETNYRLGNTFYSYEVLERKLRTIVDECFEQ